VNWWLRVRRRRTLREDLSNELAFHREMRARDGDPPPFGNATAIQESMFDLWSFHTFETAVRDVVHAGRGFRRRPALAVTLVTSLALGIGAVVAIFTAADNLLFRALPYPAPDQLVMLWESNSTLPDASHHLVSPDNVFDWQDRARAFRSIAVIDDGRSVFRDDERSEELHLQSVTVEFFSVLGVEPFLGRVPDVQAGSSGPVEDSLFISHPLWRTWFGADPNAVGRRVRLDGRPFTIVGVMPAGFSFGDRTVDLWTLMALSPPAGQRSARSVRAVGRLAPGMTVTRAQAEMTAIGGVLAQADPAFNRGWTITVEPLRDAFTRDVRSSLLIVLGAVGLLLAVACANAANLLLARNASRQAEIAIRSALGASLGRITRQLMIESLLLALASGAAGVVVGWSVLGRLIALAPSALTHSAEVAIDWRIVVIAMGVAAVTGVVFGVGPSLMAVRSVAGRELQHAGGRGTRPRRRARGLLVAGEIAIAVVLLVAGTVLVRSLLRLQAVDPGLNPAGLLTFHLRVGSPQDVHLFAESMARIEQLPGVQSVSATSFLPFVGPAATAPVTIVGEVAPGPGQESTAMIRTVMPQYFQTMGIPLRRGREFGPSDNTREAPFRFVVNEAFVHRYLARVADPLSALITTAMARTNPPGRIIGIVGDVREGSLDHPAVPTVYYPYVRLPYGQMTLVVRTAGDPMAIVGPVRRTIHDLNPSLAMADVTSMDDILGETYARQRFSAVLMTTFALFALVLAAVGVYGVVSVAVSERSREIAIRTAVGARPRRIVCMVMWEATRFVLAGLGVGLAVAFAAVTVLSGLLFDLSARDPLGFAAASLMVLVAAGVAAQGPIRQSLRVTPMHVLRGD
jgi:putative ABC transport system permease protein